MDGYQFVGNVVSGHPGDKLHFLGFKTARDTIHPYRIKMACAYQWGDKIVLLMMAGEEPSMTLSKLMTIATSLQAVTIGIRFPVTWYIRKSLWDKDYARGFNHSVYVYGGVEQWGKS